MNILCGLALSQIRGKKTRTLITITAISLSAALLTAVINFGVSGTIMLQGFLGKDFGEFKNVYTLLLMIPAAILAFLIIAMSVTVISNVFRMSADERVAQFGILKCVGATKKQIYQTIMYECLLLCIVSVPLGIILGYLLSFAGIGIANHFMDEMNLLVRVMIKQVNFRLSFVFSPVALLTSVIISWATVLFLRRPSRQKGDEDIGSRLSQKRRRNRREIQHPHKNTAEWKRKNRISAGT